ncbi:MAG: Ribonuclease H [Candidatus Peregrinibacteria bacterium GW2011_GWF2_33_10]|nr:MAG: Ribonuclease H [Candidatus Peregrinibacteria bacterium GW2011_GWF2_33_10]
MDEAGRGPWAGPVFCAAVFIPKNIRILGLNDSKLLTPSQRGRLFEIIIAKTIFGIGSSSHLEIDALGLIKAVELGFKRALNELVLKTPKKFYDHFFLQIDGRDKFVFDYPYQSIIRGDQKVKSISAASILAKVSRDRFMLEIAKKYPHYGFEKHKGYGTKLHLERLRKYGACDIHRRSFRPVEEILNSKF